MRKIDTLRSTWMRASKWEHTLRDTKHAGWSLPSGGVEIMAECGRYHEMYQKGESRELLGAAGGVLSRAVSVAASPG